MSDLINVDGWGVMSDMEGAILYVHMTFGDLLKAVQLEMIKKSLLAIWADCLESSLTLLEYLARPVPSVQGHLTFHSSDCYQNWMEAAEMNWKASHYHRPRNRCTCFSRY